MKIAVTGKGGVGKTTFAAGLSLYLSNNKKKVICLDCDPDSNLLATLGYENWASVIPVSEMKELINEKTKNNGSGFFLLNPEVSDILEKYGIKIKNIDVLVMGKIKKAEDGCYCAENTFIKNLVRHLLLKKEEYLIMDMEAGIEHLTRGTAKYNDVTFIVVEPGLRAFETASRIMGLTKDLGIKNIFLVGNKINNEKEAGFIKNRAQELNLNLAGTIGYSDGYKNNLGVLTEKNGIVREIGRIFEAASQT